MATLVCARCLHANRAEARYCGACGAALHVSYATRVVLQPGKALGPEGCYQVQRLLGRGGFGEAYLAEDQRHWGRLCLVKRLVVQEGTPAAYVPRITANFEREARLLVALNTPGHPNIPEFYHYLPDEHCLVMKYISGQSLDLVLKRQLEPLPEDEALRYVRDACAALAYMHGHAQGPILHRDLKPSNIMLDTTGRIFLIDFGLASEQPGGQHDRQPDWGGTYGYMPPEQLRGHPEPRSDVFALGATLYELVTGVHPPRPNQPLVAPTRLRPTLRPELDALILACMAAEPAQRPTAVDLLARLDDLLESAHLPAPPTPARLPDLPPALGRANEADRIKQTLATSGLVAVVGMPGIGKTTLAVSVARAYRPPEKIFWHRFLSGEGVDLLLTRLAGWLAQHGYPRAWRQLQRQHQAGQAPGPEFQAEQLAQAAGLRGSLLCLDDLHVVSDPALGRIVTRLHQAAQREGAAILITSRSLPTFLTSEQSVVLGGLPITTATDLLACHTLRLEPGVQVRLWQQTEGNPQLLALACDALRHTSRPELMIERLPETATIERYLLGEVDASLSGAERAVMGAVALLLGHGGSRQLIEALLDGASARRELAALTDRQLLTVEPGDEGSRYQQHAIIRAFYYDLHGAKERQRLHWLASRYLAEHANDQLGAARHALHADAHHEAATFLTAAPWALLNQGQASALAELAAMINLMHLEPALRAALWTAWAEACALLGHDEQAHRLIEQALAAPIAEPPVRQARRYRLLAQLHERRSDHAQAEAACRAGLALAVAPASHGIYTEAARLYAQLAEVLVRQSRHSEASVICQEGLTALPPEPAAPAERAALLQRMATITGEMGDYAQAIAMLDHSLGLARQAGDLALTGRILHNLGAFWAYSGEAARALQYLHESAHVKEQLGNRLDQIDTLNTLSIVLLAQGERDAAASALEQSCALAHQYDLQGSLASSLLSLGQLHYEYGELELAQRYLQEAATIFTAIGEVGELTRTQIGLGDLALAQGQPATAYQIASQSYALAQQCDRQLLAACALRVLGEAQLAEHDLTQATISLTEAQRLSADHSDPYDQALLDWALARLALAQSDYPAAKQQASQSLQLAQEQQISYLITPITSFLAQLPHD